MVEIPLYFIVDIYISMSSLFEFIGRHIFWPAVAICSNILYVDVAALAHWAKELQ
jgi:hypothetical protein